MSLFRGAARRAASPESIAPALRVMDSGLLAALGPGMTELIRRFRFRLMGGEQAASPYPVPAICRRSLRSMNHTLSTTGGTAAAVASEGSTGSPPSWAALAR